MNFFICQDSVHTCSYSSVPHENIKHFMEWVNSNNNLELNASEPKNRLNVSPWRLKFTKSSQEIIIG
jgi:hypothetical protein